MSENSFFARHGDLSFQPYEGNLKDLVEVEHNGSFILALGEHTGHKHVIKGDMRIFKDTEGRFVLEIKDIATITHEEHHKIEMKPGVYKMLPEQEYDYFLESISQVQD